MRPVRDGVLVLLLLCVAPASAHHSPALFDLTVIETFDATVIAFEWKNPHVFVHVERLDENGEVTRWQVEGDGVSMLLPHGWSRDSLAPGDRVSVEAHPSRDRSRRAVLGRLIVKEDRSFLLPNPDLRPDLVRAANAETSSPRSSIAGIWLPRWEEGFFALSQAAGRWPFTEDGRRYRSAPESEQNPLFDCVPYSTPRIMVIPVRTELEVLPDRVLVRVDWLDVERVVYTDGRGHPEDGERTRQGHSIGHWEGETLVVDTTSFSQGAIGGYGVPSGPDKRIEERFSLADDGRTLRYEFTLDDSEFLLEPVTGVGVWDYRSGLEPSGIDCDLDAARRDLEALNNDAMTQGMSLRTVLVLAVAAALLLGVLGLAFKRRKR